MTTLPFDIAHVGVPPIKCQGIKTKLIPFLFRSIQWSEAQGGRWVEPFLGSGSVAFNLAPQRALLTDTNKHIIKLYQAIQTGELNRSSVEEFLLCEGQKLEKGEAEYYYEVRQRFNQHGASLDFLFLNRSCFNGVMRFNRKGEFNVPFGHKPARFSRAYITKIINQINWVARQMQGKDWEFRVAPWGETLADLRRDDFLYADPPYIGRHTDYYNEWDEAEARHLAHSIQQSACGYALSMWLENRYRRNEHIDECWSDAELRICSHFYHVGSTEELRNEIDEVLAVKPGYATQDTGKQLSKKRPVEKSQLALALEKRADYLV